MTTNALHNATPDERTVMPYTFTPADPNADVQGFADMKALRESFEPMFVSVTKSKQLIDANENVLGRVTWVKALPELRARPADVQGAPTHVQPSNDRPSLDDVLASIDDLETDAEIDAARRTGVTDDAALIEDMDGDGADFEDEPAPVRLQGTPPEDIDAIVDWQMGRSGGQLPAVITTTPPPERAPRRTPRVAGPRQPRMSHKACGHAITGEAGKIARAECRARHRAEVAIAS